MFFLFIIIIIIIMVIVKKQNLAPLEKNYFPRDWAVHLFCTGHNTAKQKNA